MPWFQTPPVVLDEILHKGGPHVVQASKRMKQEQPQRENLLRGREDGGVCAVAGVGVGLVLG